MVALIGVGILIGQLFPGSFKITRASSEASAASLTLFMSRNALAELEQMAREMDASVLTVMNCTISLFCHAKDLYRQGGVLMQKIGEEEGIIEIRYTNNQNQEVCLSGTAHHPDIPESHRKIIRELGIDPDHTFD